MKGCPHAGRLSAETPPYFSGFVGGRRGEVLDAALCVFAEKGYEGGTMREIAARIGVTEPALYRYYPGKEALFEDLVALAGDHIVDRAASMMDLLTPDTVREWLAALIEMRRRDLGEAAVRPVMSTLLVAAPHHQAFRETFREHMARPMSRKLAEIVPRIDAFYGIECTPEAVESRVRIFMSLFVGYFMTAMVFDQPMDDDAVIDAMLAVMGWE